MKGVKTKLNEVLEIAEEILEKNRDEEIVPAEIVQAVPALSNNTTTAITTLPTNTLVDIFQEIEEGTKTRITELNDDITLARENLSFLIKLGRDSADELQNLAIESEEPRMYEVFSELITSISSVTKEMISLHKVRADVIKSEFEKKRPVKDEIRNLTQNNTTVYLNTSDVIKAIREGAIDGDIQPATN